MKLETLLAALVPAPVTLVENSIMGQARQVLAKQNAEKILTVAVSQLDNLIKQKEVAVAYVRRTRKQLEEQLKDLKKRDTALQYAEATGNFFPAVLLANGMMGVERLCRDLGCEVPNLKDKVLQVPKDWKKEDETVPAS